jgi:hypothetical protein
VESVGVKDVDNFLASRGVGVMPSTTGASVPASSLRQQLDAHRLHRGNVGDALNFAEAAGIRADLYITGDLNAAKALVGDETGGVLRLPRSGGSELRVRTVK